MNELLTQSASAISELIRTRKVSPTEVAKVHLQRIDDLNPALNAFVCVNAEAVLAQAGQLEQRLTAGDEVGPLAGVPVSIKSSIAVAGQAFETGSLLREGERAAVDAPLVKRLRAAGAIILGTTNVPEMLMNYFTDNSIYGQSNSPFDLDRTPGGSSGGESAAISSGMSVAGIGSDGGGSIRVPAHYCGIFGLKPTPGRVPITGHFPESGGPFAAMGVVGPMARTAEDLETMFKVTAGFDRMDPLAAPVTTAKANADPRHLRVGYFEDDGTTPVTPETRKAVRAAADALRRAGCEVVPFSPQKTIAARANWWVFFVLCGAAVLEPLFEDRRDRLSKGLSEFIEIGKASQPLTRDLLLNAWFERDRIRLEILRQMEDFPILLSPVCAIPAFKHGERRWNIDGKDVDYLQTMCYSQWVNAVGFPAVAAPILQSNEGLPIGVQIIARPYEDELALQVARILDEAFGWIAPDVMKMARSRAVTS